MLLTKPAGPLFLNEWQQLGCNVITLSGTKDAAVEATRYEEAMKKVSKQQLPLTADGLPCFDLMLIGVGLDGHVGSLYPDMPEVSLSHALGLRSLSL